MTRPAAVNETGMRAAAPAPDWHVSRWFNAAGPLALADLRGKIVVAHAFQMLCPGCVSHGVPQAERVHRLFDPRDVAVVGLHTVFEQLALHNVAFEGMILKPNMVIQGEQAKIRASVDEVADATVKVLLRCVPAAVPGIAFLSGGQSDEDASAHLGAMNARHPNLPWKLTFSYGRALQALPLKLWGGKAANVANAQKGYLHRAKLNGLAALGKYEAKLESEFKAA